MGIFHKDSLSSSHWAFAQEGNGVHPVTVTVAEPRPSCTPAAHSSEESRRQVGAVTPPATATPPPGPAGQQPPAQTSLSGPSLKPCPPGFTHSWTPTATPHPDLCWAARAQSYLLRAATPLSHSRTPPLPLLTLTPLVSRLGTLLVNSQGCLCPIPAAASCCVPPPRPPIHTGSPSHRSSRAETALQASGTHLPPAPPGGAPPCSGTLHTRSDVRSQEGLQEGRK